MAIIYLTMSLLAVTMIATINSNTINTHEKVIRWWNESSVQKPLGCEENIDYSRQYPITVQTLIESLKEKPLLQRIPCTEDQMQYQYYNFRTKTGEDESIDGPGKLRIFKKKIPRQTLHMDTKKVQCYHFQPDVKEIVGTFVNGTISGNAKVIFTNGEAMISKFVNDIPLGNTRYWNSRNELVKYCYIEKHHSLIRGRTWSKIGNMLVWTNEDSFYKEPHGESWTVFVPLNLHEKMFVGHLDLISGLVSDIHNVDVKITSSCKGCPLSLKYEIRQFEDYDLLLYKNQTKIHVIYNDHKSQMCQPFKSDESVMSKFIAWETTISNFTNIENAFELFMHLKPEIAPVDSSATKFITNITIFTESDRIKANVSLWEGKTLPWMISSMGLDSDGKLHGYFSLNLEQQFWNQTGNSNFFPWSIKSISGTFIHGLLEGYVIWITWYNTVMFASVKNGVLHGPAFAFNRQPVYDIWRRGFIPNNLDKIAPGMQFLGRFKNGIVTGHFWLGLINNGYIHGKANEQGLATGKDLAFVYPDGETALRGHFANFYMKKARYVKVLKYDCDDYGIPYVLQFTKPLSSEVFFYDPPTNYSFGGGTKAKRDPYEFKNVFSKVSNVPGSGEGVFSKRSLLEGRPACFYSLFLYNHVQEKEFNCQCLENTLKSDEYRRHCVKYSLPLVRYRGTIDLPPEFDNGQMPNLGPKVNHHFTDKNSVYVETEHPTWGLIRGVNPIHDLSSGKELYTDYGYDQWTNTQSDFPRDFPWYWAARRTYLENKSSL